jgi:hypothetical protein
MDFFPNKEIFHMSERETGEYHEDSHYNELTEVERFGLGKK